MMRYSQRYAAGRMTFEHGAPHSNPGQLSNSGIYLMSFYKKLKHLSIVISSFILGACQHIGAAPADPQHSVTHPASLAWTPGELQLFTDYGEYLCKASTVPVAIDPPE